MRTTRLEAFSDGVIAILITIMVLELKPPHGADLASLIPLVPVALSYALSFVYLGIYWNNHHHMFSTARHVSGGIMWGNLHLLFWLSLIPFVTAWMGENHFAAVPVAVYGFVLFMCAISYSLLQEAIIRSHGPNSLLRKAVRGDLKGKASLALYLAAVGSAFVNAHISEAIYVFVALMWIVPDRRIERLNESRAKAQAERHTED